ncbi:MAG: autotransporter domain-containing protein, partial [Candidatus Berkiellales bacterium]
AYGWLEFNHNIYLDVIAGLATNEYKTNRVINVNQIHTAAQADFDGTQFGIQSDLGWLLFKDENSYLSPFARLRYTYLDLEDYTESGANDFNLSVNNHNPDEFLGGLGLKFGMEIPCPKQNMLYVPEVSALVAYDFDNDGEQTIAGFIGGGPQFATNGVRPGRTILNLDVGLNTYIAQEGIITVKYDLEWREKFTSNAVYLQYNYLFG